MKISFISTVFNEADNINAFLESIDFQSTLPDEVIIANGGSTDDTVGKILSFKPGRLKNKITLINLWGNRSSGRNEAIKRSTGNIIVCSDAGNVLDKDWIKNITKPFNDPSVDVVAGYYKGVANNAFQKCLIPYVLVMPDRVDPDKFLPATRSMAFRKSVWKKIGGFNEKFSHNEDYEFARRLKKNNFNIIFAKDAIVNWIPPNSLTKAFIMFFRFAFGDAEAKIYRLKAVLVIGRYLLGLVLFTIQLYAHSFFLLILIIVLIFNYTIWSIIKNYQYVKDIRAVFYLPVIQIFSDLAVISGSVLGFLKSNGK